MEARSSRSLRQGKPVVKSGVPRTITIAGGGLAGLSLGIALRRRGAKVELWEVERYPRHRVCGEFLSGIGLLWLRDNKVDAPGRVAKDVRFFLPQARSPRFNLPRPALAVSRFELDAALAERFTEMGGVLREGSRWQGDYLADGVVRATGRRLSREEGGLTGVKMHVRGLEMAEDLEMHFGRNAYCGLAKLKDGCVNVCALARAEEKITGIRSMFPQVLGRWFGRDLERRLAEATPDESSFRAVTGMTFAREPESGECRIGDSYGMIAPLTGNGMSLAMESAELAAGTLAEYSHGILDWEIARTKVSQEWEARFGKRLGISSFLQKMLFHRSGQSMLLFATRRMPTLFRHLFHCTRQ